MGDDNVVHIGQRRSHVGGRKIVPNRLRDARRALRMTQEEIGRLAQVTRQAISSYEAGEKSPDPPTFSRLLVHLEQPAIYFLSDDRPVFGQFSPRFFRKTGPETVRKNDACAVLGNWLVQIVYYLNDWVNYPSQMIPSVRPNAESGRYTPEEIETAAELCRQEWGLGVGPISNVLKLIEARGIFVSRYDMQGEKIDAFSFWNHDRPFILLAAEKESGARVRYDALHELGHLVLHKWIDSQELSDPKVLKIIEWEANRFASAFLLPRQSFPYEIYTPRLDAFVELKRRWAVSVQAMVYRCRDLEIIDEDQFTNLYKQISFRKWRTKEPLDDPAQIRVESPTMIGRAMNMLLESGKKSPNEILVDLGLSGAAVEEFCNLPKGTLFNDASVEIAPSLTMVGDAPGSPTGDGAHD